MNWRNTAGNIGGGAMAGGAVGGWPGAAAGAGMGLINSFMGDPYEDAMHQEQQGYDEAQGYQQPYNQNGQAQYGRLNEATGKLMDPTKLQDEWSKNYETSDYAKRQLAQNQTQGMDAASSMGLSGSSAALGNIQQGAGNIVAKDRQQYMDDLMKKYMVGIGLGQNMYGVGANTAQNMGDRAMTHGENKGRLAFGQTQSPQTNLAQGAGMMAGQYGQNRFNSMPAYAQNAIYG